MTKYINGIDFLHKKNYATCYIDSLSKEFKDIIRARLTSVCHGIALSKSLPKAYNYKGTLEEFFKRFNEKTDKIKKGMVGELLVHILVLEFFSEFEAVSPYFNMEEKSMRKAYDVLLYDKTLKEVWITEVKSGELLEDKDACKTTNILLNKAHSDLTARLNEQSQTFWLQAINSVRVVIEDGKDYKEIVQEILADELDLVSKKCAKSNDNNVIITSVLFEDINNRVDESVPRQFSLTTEKTQKFKRLIILSIQKSTYQKIVDFLKEELG